MTRRSRKAIIIGAGIAGPATAIFLRKAGFETEIFEAWPYASGIGGGLQIAPNGMQVLDAIGLADEMIRVGSIAESFDFRSQNGSRLGSINHHMQQRFGQPAVNMARATLNEAMLSKARREGVTVTFDKRLAHVEDRGDQPIVAHFTDGSSAEGDFLIGADGVHSMVRGHVNPDGPVPFDTGLIGFGGFVPRSVLEAASIGGQVETTFGQSGFFGCGFCSPDSCQGGMWWSTQPSHGVDVTTFRAMSQPELKEHLRRFHAGWHDPIPQIIEAIDDIVVTPTLDIATLPAWSRHRTLLIGDAAHATTPHAGQGASLALEDSMRLGLLMAKGDELGFTFQSFESERRPRTEKIVARARRNGNNKHEFSPIGAWIRDRMLQVMIPISAWEMDWMYAYNPRAA